MPGSLEGGKQFQQQAGGNKAEVWVCVHVCVSIQSSSWAPVLEQRKACRKVDARGPNITVGLEPFDKSNNTGQEWQKPQPTAVERYTEIMALH